MAAALVGADLDGEVAVCATNRLDGTGSVFSVGGFANEFSDWDGWRCHRRQPLPRQRRRRRGPLAYTDHLLKVAASGPLLDIVAAILPCYWVYHRAGEPLAASLPDHDLYRTWIQSYASPQFGEAVVAQLNLLDEIAARADEASLERARRWFGRSLRYERMFWDQAYHRLDWP